jgi:DNA-binding transcriptional MerR regulator
MADLLSIGRFSRLSGLSVHALRHYDELGLLRPAEVDPETGYRRYASDQLATARVIARLRGLDLPLGLVAAYLGAPDSEAAAQILARHRSGVEARSSRLLRITHHLNQVIDAGATLMSAETRDPAIDRETRRRLAVDLFNHVWTLLETTERTVEQDDEMVHAAHASRYHWGEVGEPANLARGEWQCSRVYAVLGRGEPALHHARRCLEICQQHGIGDWDLAFAYEALARASRVAGNLEGRERYAALAREAGLKIAEAEDREGFEADMATV